MNLKDLPQPVPDRLKENIEAQLIAEMRSEAESRRQSVARGAETAELAAALFDKFGWGMSKAAFIIGIDSMLQAEVDRIVREIDPAFNAHRKARWAARPASLLLHNGEESVDTRS